jgi:hypothetical protein
MWQPTARLAASYNDRGSYSASIVVSVDNATAATDLHAVAYTAAGSYPVVSADPRCANHTLNRSIACAQARTAWTFTLTVAAPAHAIRPIAVHVHVSASDAAPFELIATVTRAPLVASNASVPSSVGEDISASTGMRGVFSFAGGCATPKTPVILIALVCFAVLMVGRIAHMRRRQVITDVDVQGASPWRALLPVHLWAGAAVPCHRFCGPIHTALLFAHVLTMMAVASSLLTPYHALAADPVVAVAIGLVASVVSTTVAAVLDVPFRAFSLRLHAPAYSSARYKPHDLTEFGVARHPHVGVRAATCAALPAVQCNSGANAEEEDGRTWYGATVAVDVRRVRRFASAATACVIAAAATVTFVNTLPWCGETYRAFERTVLAAVLVDAAVVQPVAVALACLWRWMTSEEDGVIHRLHPIGGQSMPDADELGPEELEEIIDAADKKSVVDETP